jgi:uncharacterized protein with HEPN domain
VKHPERVEDYLDHIVEAITRAVSYLDDVEDFEAFQRDRRSQDAIIRNIEIIGEAVSQIQSSDPEFIPGYPDVPWAKMRGMRNAMIHEYFSVNVRIVWATVRDDLPDLQRLIEGVVDFPAHARREAVKVRRTSAWIMKFGSTPGVNRR